MPIVFVHGVRVRDQSLSPQVETYLRRYVAPEVDAGDPDGVSSRPIANTRASAVARTRARRNQYTRAGNRPRGCATPPMGRTLGNPGPRLTEAHRGGCS